MVRSTTFSSDNRLDALPAEHISLDFEHVHIAFPAGPFGEEEGREEGEWCREEAW